MAESTSDYYLQEVILNENGTVTYQSLARHLKIHIDEARKTMLEFSRGHPETQLIYLVAGMKQLASTVVSEDSELVCTAQSSYQLARASELEDIKRSFDKVSSVTVYAMSGVILQDFDELVPIINHYEAQTVAYSKEDAKKFGFIYNKNSKPRDEYAETLEKQQKKQPSVVKLENKRAATVPVAGRPTSTKPSVKRQTKRDKENEELASMMEVDDESFAPSTRTSGRSTPSIGSVPVDSKSTTSANADQESDVNESITSRSNGRKRGKRKVLKKETTTDEEGFIVVRENYVWESFSEDEETASPESMTAAKPKRSNTAPVRKRSTAAPKKKTQQKSIMSFFGKN
ncbi:DNA polymerase delta subunit Cdc27 [Schizosaccharomyces japonicus yFS275]|uniref:DNA polymerase delta subunit 3 n=1 Tax=Schizosaccharomyces japonicus (strain yFS275 / FY16936) TaxID=402676 RepID=B6JWN7_SCHJY|nr:DNA polymerase delta subunit Cdc27 [Schizosaccharomyces japonicus yFS275]EEB05788.1 DNA polymerase delta subunit Cdc27 [Schizosaccharomyces japonicus yFS275]